jgi:hypothetical protein
MTTQEIQERDSWAAQVLAEVIEEENADREAREHTPPRFEHDCKACLYLGHYVEFDVYFCAKSDGGSLIARFGGAGHQYSSSSIDMIDPVFYRRRAEYRPGQAYLWALTSPIVARALREHRERKLLAFRQQVLSALLLIASEGLEEAWIHLLQSQAPADAATFALDEVARVYEQDLAFTARHVAAKLAVEMEKVIKEKGGRS